MRDDSDRVSSAITYEAPKSTMLGKIVQLKTTGLMGENRGEAHHSEQNVKDRSLRTIGSEFHTQWLNIIAPIKEALCLESNLKYTREVTIRRGVACS